MTNPSTDKSNAEIAAQVVREWIEHDLDENPQSDYVAGLETGSLEERMCEALSSAQSSLAEKVLATMDFQIPCVDKDHDERWCPTCSAQRDAQDVLDSRLRDLFARLGVKISGE